MSEIITDRPIERIELTDGSVAWLQRKPQSKTERIRNWWRRFFGFATSEDVDLVLLEKVQS